MSSGYLLATRFEVLYEAALQSGRYNENPVSPEPIYGIPHRSVPLKRDGVRRYRGIDRDPLRAMRREETKLFTETGTPCEATPATILLDEIERDTGREDGWVTAATNIRKVWAALGADQVNYEIIFAKEYQDNTSSPDGAEFLGCDVAYFVSDHFSCICDALFFPRWHGTDPEGVLFRQYFDLLNRNGLFDSNSVALDYLRYYLGFDWTERDDTFTSIEVFAAPNAGR